MHKIESKSIVGQEFRVLGIKWRDIKKLPVFQGLAIKEMRKHMPIDKIGFGMVGDEQVYLLKSTYRNGKLLSIWKDTGTRVECFYKRFFGKEKGK